MACSMALESPQVMLLLHETCLVHKDHSGGCTYEMQPNVFKTVLNALSKAFGTLTFLCIHSITLFDDVLVVKMVPPFQWEPSETRGGFLCSRAVVTLYENKAFEYAVTTSNGVVRREGDSEDFEDWQIGLHLCLKSAMKSGLVLNSVAKYNVQGKTRVRLVFSDE